ncbi:MAG: FAD-dependent oxidoreductase [Bifidobacteriaceae bacterium]|jgi:succinate dehydrogenase/fumarate reductase flavoprotein subunit|nr:FAD-dependent oxidoreductase [Bifidobacteriaceae bacterium]
MRELKSVGTDRRSFLKGAALVGAGVAVTGLAAACTPSSTGDDETSPSPTTGGEAPSSDIMTPEDLQKKWAFEIPPDPIPEDQIAETVAADLVVVGCGTSGLLTAISAQAHGLANVVIVSASQAPVSRGGSNNCVYSKYMEEVGLAKIPIIHYQREISQMYNNCNQALWYRFYNNSTEAMNYLIDLMTSKGYYVGMERAADIPEDDLYYQPFCSHAFLDGGEFSTPGTAQPLLVKTVAEEFQAKGGAIHFGHKAEQLIRDDNNTGRVSAVIAKRLEDDAYVKFTAAKAIVLAMGDFSKNRDMMYKYAPHFAPVLDEQGVFDTPVDYDKGLDPFSPGLMNGDGHMMGLWIGAAWQKNNPNTLMGSTFSAGVAGTYAQNFPGLIVDRNGKRFMNEFASARMAGMSMLHTDGSQVFAIWDANYASYPGMWYDTWDAKSPVTAPDAVMAGWDTGVENGFYFKADTLDDLITQLGLPPEETKATIERYNQLCEAGEDTDFYKRKEGLNAITTGPFYGSKSGARDFLTVLGGLRTNTDLQVCEEDDTPIPGLYNVGTMIGDLYGGVYTFQLQGVNYGASCVTFGYLTGKLIAESA